jgi:hypothetical protein
MSRIARMPEPPYYAVIAPSALSPDVKGYPELGLRLIQLARSIDGFLGIELCMDPSFSLAVSYWRSLEAIETWRRNAQHLVAKDLGKQRWFAEYVTRIARVEQVY